MSVNDLLQELYEKALFVKEQSGLEYPDIDVTDADAVEMAEVFLNLHKAIHESGKIPDQWIKSPVRGAGMHPISVDEDGELRFSVVVGKVKGEVSVDEENWKYFEEFWEKNKPR